MLVPYVSRTVLSWTPEDYVRACRNADNGNLRDAATFVDAMWKDDRIGGVLEARVKGMLALPASVISSTGAEVPVIPGWPVGQRPESPEALARRDTMHVFPEAEQEKLVKWGVSLGIGWARRARKWCPETETWKMAVRTWDPRWFQWRDSEQRWYVACRVVTERGQFGRSTLKPIDEVDGFFSYTPFGDDAPWKQGLWHRCAVPFLSKTYAVDDRSREGEVTPILVGETKGLNERQRKTFLEDLKGLADDSRIVLPEGCKVSVVTRSDGSRASIHAETITWADQANTITIAGQLTTTEGAEGFSSGSVQKQVLASILRSQERTFATCVGENVLTPWAQLSIGWDEGVLYPRWQIQDPSDLTAQAYAAKELGGSLENINRALAADNVRIDIRQLVERTGLPIIDLPTKNADDTATVELPLAPTDVARLITVDEGRASLGLPPLPDGRGKGSLAELAAAQQVDQIAAEEQVTQQSIMTRATKATTVRRSHAVLTDDPPSEFRIFAWGENAADDGAVAMLTPEGVEEMQRRRGNRDGMIDLEHLSLARDSVNYDPDARGSYDWSVRDDGLWAVNVRWTSDGETRIREKRQRYTSPAFRTDADGTIVELVNVALTSLPATTYIEPLIAASKGASNMDPEQMMALVKEKLELGEDATIEQVLIKMLEAMDKGMPAKAPESTEASSEMGDEEEAMASEMGDEEKEAMASETGDEEKEDAASVAMRALRIAKEAEREAIKLRNELASKRKAELIARNRSRLPGKLHAWAQKQTPKALEMFFASAPEIGDVDAIEPEPETTITLSKMDREMCAKFGTDPEKVAAIRRRNAMRR